jgi:DNA replication and repair protein RecF
MLDDLSSELDRNHQQRLLDRLRASGAQVFITGAETPAALEAVTEDVSRFHVEHGQIEPLTSDFPSVV